MSIMNDRGLARRIIYQAMKRGETNLRGYIIVHRDFINDKYVIGSYGEEIELRAGTNEFQGDVNGSYLFKDYKICRDKHGLPLQKNIFTCWENVLRIKAWIGRQEPRRDTSIWSSPMWLKGKIKLDDVVGAQRRYLPHAKEYRTLIAAKKIFISQYEIDEMKRKFQGLME